MTLRLFLIEAPWACPLTLALSPAGGEGRSPTEATLSLAEHEELVR